MDRPSKPVFSIKSLDETSSDFDLVPDLRPKNRSLREAAVLIPLQKRNDHWRVVLTKRSSELAHHPGQIAFPGGKVDPTDAGPLVAALREADEEIGLSPTQAFVIGQLPAHETVTGFKVEPYVAVIDPDFKAHAEVGEVAEVFSVPLEHVTDLSRFLVQSREWMGVRRSYYAVPFGPYYIWGATARMLFALANALEGPNAD